MKNTIYGHQNWFRRNILLIGWRRMKMTNYYDPILAEVRKNRRELSEQYISLDKRPDSIETNLKRLEQEGCHFATPEEMEMLKAKHKNPPISEIFTI